MDHSTIHFILREYPRRAPHDVDPRILAKPGAWPGLPLHGHIVQDLALPPYIPRELADAAEAAQYEADFARLYHPVPRKRSLLARAVSRLTTWFGRRKKTSA